MQATFRPLPAWPYQPREARPATYRVGHGQNLVELEYEIAMLEGTEVIIGLVMDARDVRMDGMPKANAKVRYPGVELSFEVHGKRLTFYTDTHRTGYANDWQDNLRAITLGLRALRAVARYGITEGIGQQYAGFAQIEAGPVDRGRRLVEEAGSIPEALRRNHPDHGGDSRAFRDVIAYRASLDP